MKMPKFLTKIAQKIKQSYLELSKPVPPSTPPGSSFMVSLKLFLISYPRFFMTVFLYTISPFILAFIIYLILTSHKPTTQVPQLQGLSMIDAANLLQNNKLKPLYLTIDSDEYPNYFVVEQDIKAGRKVKEGKEIILYISETGDVHQFPDFVGKNFFLVQNTLGKANSTIQKVFLNSVEWIDSEKPFGEIISQNPDKGSYKEFPIGISFIVSKGRMLSLPYFVDQYAGDALSFLHTNGIKVVVDYKEVNDPLLSGKVIEQAPKAGTVINERSYTHLIVGQYKNHSRYFVYAVPTDLNQKHIKIVFKDNRGSRTLFEGEVKEGDILLPATQVDGEYTTTIYTIENGQEQFYKELQQ